MIGAVTGIPHLDKVGAAKLPLDRKTPEMSRWVLNICWRICEWCQWIERWNICLLRGLRRKQINCLRLKKFAPHNSWIVAGGYSENIVEKHIITNSKSSSKCRSPIPQKPTAPLSLGTWAVSNSKP